MGSGGHNRKPRDAHIIEGTFRKDRHGDTVEAKSTGKPTMPKGLDYHGKWMWNECVKLQWVKSADGATCRAVALAWSTWMKYQKAASSDPGLQRIANESLDKWIKLSSKLGLNPVDRSRIKDDGEANEQDEFEQFLAQGG